MGEKKSGLKKLFSKNKDCCSVEFEEVDATEDDDCCGESEESKNQKKKAEK